MIGFSLSTILCGFAIGSRQWCFIEDLLVMYIGTTLGSLVGGILYGHISGFLSVTIFTSLSFMISLLLFNIKVKEKNISDVVLVGK
jgi:uncharacterized membrane protein YfcA